MIRHVPLLAPVVVAVLALLAPAPARAQPQDTPALPSLVPRRAAIDAGNAGLVRLALPREVIEAARPDLSDVRVVDAHDREIPYLVDRGDRPMPRTIADPPTAIPVLPRDARRERRRERSVDRFVERYELAVPGSAPPRATWLLRIASIHPRFASAVRVAAIDPDGTERDLATGSFYRLGTPTREHLELALPPLTTERVRVTIEGQDGYLEPRFSFVAQREDRSAERVDVPLAIADTRREPGYTVLIVEPPAGVSPEQITIATGTASFVRPVEVTAIDRDRGRRFLGSATVLRVDGVPGAEALEVPVTGSGDRLEITIHDGDSPPLASIALTARVRATSLVFQGSDAAMLRFGGGRLRAPRYDLQALFGTRLGETLLDQRIAGEATLGPIEDEPAFDPSPALAFAMRPGAELDASRFERAATLTLDDPREGLSRFVAAPDLLASSQRDLRDLRVTGEDGRQWPYLVSSDRPVIDLALAVGPAVPIERDGERWSDHRVTLPVARIAPASIALAVGSPFVDRWVRVVAIDEDGGEREIGQSIVSRRPGEEARLQIPTDGSSAETIVLRVRDGDEAPLAIEGATAELPSYEIFLVAPAGTYRVLTGDEEARAPDYEIARARELIVAVVPAPAVVSEVRPNPAFRAPGLLDRTDAETIAVWVVLVLSVLVLGAVTLRVARTAPPDAPPTSGPGSGTESGPGPTPDDADPPEEPPASAA